MRIKGNIWIKVFRLLPMIVIGLMTVLSIIAWLTNSVLLEFGIAAVFIWTFLVLSHKSIRFIYDIWNDNRTGDFKKQVKRSDFNPMGHKQVSIAKNDKFSYEMKIKFDKDSIYEPVDRGTLNRLFGISFWHHKYESMNFYFRRSAKGDKMRIYVVEYNEGVKSKPRFLTTVWLNEWYRFEIYKRPGWIRPQYRLFNNDELTPMYIDESSLKITKSRIGAVMDARMFDKTKDSVYITHRQQN